MGTGDMGPGGPPCEDDNDGMMEVYGYTCEDYNCEGGPACPRTCGLCEEPMPWGAPGIRIVP